jgi:hypothetical protein
LRKTSIGKELLASLLNDQEALAAYARYMSNLSGQVLPTGSEEMRQINSRGSGVTGEGMGTRPHTLFPPTNMPSDRWRMKMDG